MKTLFYLILFISSIVAQAGDLGKIRQLRVELASQAEKMSHDWSISPFAEPSPDERKWRALHDAIEQEIISLVQLELTRLCVLTQFTPTRYDQIYCVQSKKIIPLSHTPPSILHLLENDATEGFRVAHITRSNTGQVLATHSYTYRGGVLHPYGMIRVSTAHVPEEDREDVLYIIGHFPNAKSQDSEMTTAENSPTRKN